MSQLSDAKRDDLRDTWQWNKEQLRWKFVKLWFDSLCCRKAVHEIHFGFVESHIQHVEKIRGKPQHCFHHKVLKVRTERFQCKFRKVGKE